MALSITECRLKMIKSENKEWTLLDKDKKNVIWVIIIYLEQGSFENWKFKEL